MSSNVEPPKSQQYSVAAEPADSFEDSHPPGRLRVRVTCLHAIGNNWLAHRLADFQVKQPGIDVEIHTTMRVLDLTSGEFDVAIRFVETPSPEHFSVLLFEDEEFPVCSPEYINKIGRLEKPADLARATLLRHAHLPWKPWFEVAGLDWPEPSTGPLFGEAGILLSTAVSGAGIALAGRVVLQQELRAGRLLRLFDIGVVPRRKYYAVCTHENLKRLEVSAFLDWLVREAKEDVFKGIEEKLRRSHTTLQLIVENLPTGAVHVEGNHVTFNKAAEKITGYSRNEISTLDQWFSKLYGPRGTQMLLAYKKGRSTGALTMANGSILRKGGMERFVEYSNFVYPDGEVWLMDDVSTRKEAEERVRRLAYHDPLTGLPNRLKYSEHLQLAIARARRTACQIGVMFIDLDGFKQVNDSLGHGAGDEVLKEVGNRLQHCVREADTVARFGGDEFAVLLDNVTQSSSFHAAATRILSSLEQPIVLGAEKRQVGASIGISVYPDDGADVPDLIKHADFAMYEAKSHGKNRYCLYSASGLGNLASPGDQVVT